MSETLPSDELPAASPGDPDGRDRTPDGRFRPGNSWARLAKLRAGPRGALLALEAKGDPAWRTCRRWARRASAQRLRELARLHGGELSGGVGALVTDAWDLRGDARYLQARAVRDDNPDLLRVAATLLASARQSERDAWELGAREAAARKASAVPDWRRLLEVPEAPAPSMPAEHAPRHAESVSGTPPASGTPDDETRSQGQPACSTAAGGEEGSP